jgi:hypothetical protein
MKKTNTILQGLLLSVLILSGGWQPTDAQTQLTGKQRLLMSDFGIDPPTALLGLIRARDRILVRFDLVAVSVTTPTTTTHSTQ